MLTASRLGLVEFGPDIQIDARTATFRKEAPEVAVEEESLSSFQLI